MKVNDFQGGSAAFRIKLNELVRGLNQLLAVTGGGGIGVYNGDAGSVPQLFIDSFQHRIPRGKRGGVVTASFAMITSRTGSAPPYRYAGIAAAMDVDGGWTQVENGTVYDPMFNIEEQGSGASYVNPLLTGDVVLVLRPTAAVSAYACVRGHYRGTY